MTASVTADADHGWLAKVLAGDPLHLGLLDLASTLSVAELDAFTRCGRRIAAGMPVSEAADLMRREVGRVPA